MDRVGEQCPGPHHARGEPVTAATLHPRLQEIAGDFTALPGAERLQLLLEFSEELPSLPPRYAEHPDLLEPVPECQSPLFLAVEVEPDATVHLYFDAPNLDEARDIADERLADCLNMLVLTTGSRFRRHRIRRQDRRRLAVASRGQSGDGNRRRHQPRDIALLAQSVLPRNNGRRWCDDRYEHPGLHG